MFSQQIHWELWVEAIRALGSEHSLALATPRSGWSLQARGSTISAKSWHQYNPTSPPGPWTSSRDKCLPLNMNIHPQGSSKYWRPKYCNQWATQGSFSQTLMCFQITPESKAPHFEKPGGSLCITAESSYIHTVCKDYCVHSILASVQQWIYRIILPKQHSSLVPSPTKNPIMLFFSDGRNVKTALTSTCTLFLFCKQFHLP